MSIDEAFEEVIQSREFVEMAKRVPRYQRIKYLSQFPGEVKELAKIRVLRNFKYQIMVVPPQKEKGSENAATK